MRVPRIPPAAWIAAGAAVAGGAAGFTTAKDDTPVRLRGGLDIAVPVTAGGLAVASVAAQMIARPNPPWPGAPGIGRIASHATVPLLALAAGTAVGYGVAQLFNGQSPGGGSALSDEQLRAQNASREQELEAQRAAGKLTRDEVDAAIAAAGGIGAEGTFGEGRLDVSNLTNEQAVDLLLRAYADHDGVIGIDDLRVDGPSTFTIERLIRAASDGGTAATRAQLLTWFNEHVDTRVPKGVIDRSEATDWQSSGTAEERRTAKGTTE